jgi:signal transduction histidine kinase
LRGEESGVLAAEQTALRRVATLVARGVSPADVFTAVVEEVGWLLPVEYTLLGRYEPDDMVTFVAGWGRAGPLFPNGARLLLGGNNLATSIAQTGRADRIDSWTERSGPLGDALCERGVRWSVGTPIMVEGRLWGLMAAGSIGEQHLRPDTEARLAQFTELSAMAIANAESRVALAASRARVVAAADEVRRRIERDLHDGTQQQLVSLMLAVRAARATERPKLDEVRTQLERTERGLAGVLKELREISQGIHPAVLSRGGLGPALRVLAHRSALPVQLDLQTERRLPAHIEVAAYYVVSEALTNAAKHAHASTVKVDLKVHSALVQLAIRDDGVGGANLGQGSGLIGLRDRVEALGGILQLTSPTGSGTTLFIEIPVEGQNSAVWPVR